MTLVELELSGNESLKEEEGIAVMKQIDAAHRPLCEEFPITPVLL